MKCKVIAKAAALVTILKNTTTSLQHCKYRTHKEFYNPYSSFFGNCFLSEKKNTIGITATPAESPHKQKSLIPDHS